MMISPETLKRQPFFSFLTDAQARAVAMISDETSVEAGESIFEPDTPANALWVFVEGAVDQLMVVIDHDDPRVRKEFFLSEINPGDVLALQSLVPPYLHAVAARAAAPSKLIRVDAPALRALCEAAPDFAHGLMAQAAHAALDKLAVARAHLAAARA